MSTNLSEQREALRRRQQDLETKQAEVEVLHLQLMTQCTHDPAFMVRMPGHSGIMFDHPTMFLCTYCGLDTESMNEAEKAARATNPVRKNWNAPVVTSPQYMKMRWHIPEIVTTTSPRIPA